MSIFAILAVSRAVAGPSFTPVMPSSHQDTPSKGSKRCPHSDFQLKSHAAVEVTRDTSPEFTIQKLASPNNSQGCPHFKPKSQPTPRSTDGETQFRIKQLFPRKTNNQADVSRTLESTNSDNYFRGRDMRPMIPFPRKERLMEDPIEYHAPRSTAVYNPPRGRNMKLRPEQRTVVNARAARNELEAHLETLNVPTPHEAPYTSSSHDSSSSGSFFDYRLGNKKVQGEKDEEEKKEKEEEWEDVKDDDDDDDERVLAWIHAVED